MPWYWTDDLARLLAEDASTDSPPDDWLNSPVAVRRPSTDPLQVARELVGTVAAAGGELVA